MIASGQQIPGVEDRTNQSSLVVWKSRLREDRPLLYIYRGHAGVLHNNCGFRMSPHSISLSQTAGSKLTKTCSVRLSRSLVGRSRRFRCFRRHTRSLIEPDQDQLTWKTSLLASVQSRDELFLLLHALDECPEDSGARQNLLECLERARATSTEPQNLRC